MNVFNGHFHGYTITVISLLRKLKWKQVGVYSSNKRSNFKVNIGSLIIASVASHTNRRELRVAICADFQATP